jgi:hypothetical protein
MTSSVVASPCPMCGDLLTVHLASKIVLGKKYNLEKCTTRTNFPDEVISRVSQPRITWSSRDPLRNRRAKEVLL